MKQEKILMAVATAIFAMLCGCGEQSEQSHRLKYLAVQMEKNADWSIVDKDGKEVVKEEYPADASISDVSDEGCFWVRSGGKYQLFSIEQPKKPIIDEEFNQATNFSCGLAVVGSPNTPIRIIDIKGQVVATLGTDIKRCFGYYDDYAIVQNIDDLYGVIDRDGKTVLKPAYTDIRGVSKGLVSVRKTVDAKTWDILNMKGEKLGEINSEKYVFHNISDGKFSVHSADNPSGPTIILDEKGTKLFDIKKAPGDKNQGSYFKDGYFVFTDAEGKKGVVDENGEIQIRGRYEDLFNIGCGEFAAKKGDKWGIVNAKDETIVDFDFTYYSWRLLSENYLLRDGNTWSLMNKENKEIASFEKIGGSGQDYFADYVNIGNLVGSTAKMLEEFEYPMTAKGLAEKAKLSIDECHNVNSHQFAKTFDEKVDVTLKMLFFNNLAEERTHIEKVNDGWFTTDKVVSDGWVWRNEPFSIIEGIIKLRNDIDFTNFAKALDARIKQTHKELSDGEYSRTVDASGKKVTYRLKLDHTAGGFDVSIQELQKYYREE